MGGFIRISTVRIHADVFFLFESCLGLFLRRGLQGRVRYESRCLWKVCQWGLWCPRQSRENSRAKWVPSRGQIHRSWCQALGDNCTSLFLPPWTKSIDTAWNYFILSRRSALTRSMSVTSNATFAASVMGTPTSTGLAPNSVCVYASNSFLVCRWMRKLYWTNSAFKDSTNFDHIKTHYYWSHSMVCSPWCPKIWSLFEYPF